MSKDEIHNLISKVVAHSELVAHNHLIVEELGYYIHTAEDTTKDNSVAVKVTIEISKKE